MLVGIHGKAESGKDTVGDVLEEEYNFIKASFADNLKVFVMTLFNLSPKQVFTKEGKREIVPGTGGKTVRRVLQEVGEKMREIDPDIWIKQAFASPDVEKAIRFPTRAWTFVVFCDVRFPNEFQCIKNEGGCLIKVVRPDYQALEGAEAEHASECSLDRFSDSAFDLVITAASGEVNKIKEAVRDFYDERISTWGVKNEEAN